MSQVKERRDDLTLEEKRALVARLLKEKAAGGRAGPGLVHRWIEAQAARTPDAVAVAAGDRSLTYRQLNGRANRLARRLRGLGVGPEVLVGVCTSRSPDMLVALLAVLKAGGAYVPLDPAFPADRLAYHARRRTGPGPHHRGAATAAHCPRARPASSASTRIGPRSMRRATRTSKGARARRTSPTSSTPPARPAGPRACRSPTPRWPTCSARCAACSASRPDDALLAVTTLSFDIAALELFLPLIVGARVELVERDVAADGTRLIERLDAPGITFLQATPATWRLLLEAGWRGKPGLTMLCGGEAMPRTLADRLLDKGAALWNLYGPTETTVWSSAWRVEPGDGPISIGRPIAETRFYVLDRRLRAVPVGVTGELYIGGAGLARGYRGRPGLTAERFLPDPFASGARRAALPHRRPRPLAAGRHARMPRAGRPPGQDPRLPRRAGRDRGGAVGPSRRPRGRRRGPSRRHRRDEPRRVSRPAWRGGRASGRRAAGDGSCDRLPEYMVPSAFVVLDALPLTPNGKVDRKALPDPAHARRAEGADFVPPRGPIEEALAEIWAELLGVDRVGVHDNFFEPRRPFADGPPARRPHPQPLRRRGTVEGLHRGADPLELRPPGRAGPGRPGRHPDPAHRAGGPLRPPARLLRPAAALVPRPAPARQPRLQHPHRRPARRPARPRCPPPRPRGGRPPPRGPADHVRRGGRRAPDGHQGSGEARPARRGPLRALPGPASAARHGAGPGGGGARPSTWPAARWSAPA